MPDAPTVGLIGCGAMGRRHAAALESLARRGRIRFTGIYDPAPEGHAMLRAENPAAAAPFSNGLDAFYAAAQPEAVVIATTAPHHLPHLETAAERGVAMALVEKPLAVSVAQARRIRELAEGGLRIAVNHQWPFFPAYARLRALAQGNAFGGVVSAAIVAGAFGAAMGGSHAIFLFEWLSNARLTRATAWFDDVALPNPRGAAFSDRAGAMRFETADGRALTVSCGAEQRHGLLEVWSCRTGQIIVDRLTSSAWLRHRRPEDRDAPAGRYALPGEAETIALEPMDLVAASAAHLEALLDGDTYVDAAWGAHVVELLAAAHLSAERDHAPVLADALSCDDAGRVFPWC